MNKQQNSSPTVINMTQCVISFIIRMSNLTINFKIEELDLFVTTKFFLYSVIVIFQEIMWLNQSPYVSSHVEIFGRFKGCPKIYFPMQNRLKMKTVIHRIVSNCGPLSNCAPPRHFSTEKYVMICSKSIFFLFKTT